MEKISFFDILVESWNLSFSRTKFLVFGFFMALPIAAQFLLPTLSQSDPQTILEYLLHNKGQVALVISVALLCTIFGKAMLLRELYSNLQDKSKQKPLLFSFSKTFGRLAILELLFGTFLILLNAVLSLPLFLSWYLYDEISIAIVLLATIIIIPLLLFTYIIRQFSYYYFLFSPLTLRSAIERAAALFLKYRSLAILFGIFCLALYGVFTFSLNLAMLGGVVLLQSLSVNLTESQMFFLISLVFLTWYVVLSQSLWLRFFLRLAKPPTTISDVTPLVISEQVPESPIT